MTWAEICEDPVLRELPYKIESDRWGRVVMSPRPDFWHGNYETEIATLLKRLMPAGHVVSECPVETADGVKGVDVVWLSASRHPGRHRYTVMKVAPEICVEIVSPSNTSAEMEEWRRLFFECRAEEVWQCEEGRMQFFTSRGPIAASKICPAFPNELKV
jgi:Uma2 family endonuclease